MTGETQSLAWELLRAFAILILLLPIAYFATRLYAHRMHKAGQASATRVIEVVALGPGRQLYLVELGERLLLLGATAHSISVVAQITDPDEVAELLHRADRPRQGAFLGVLQAKLDEKRPGGDKP